MLNDPTNGAAGEAVSAPRLSLTRRLFLRGAAVAAPLAAVPALAAVSSAYAEENPALLALEPELAAAEAEMIAAADAYRTARRIGDELWPRAPEEITYERASHEWGPYERDIAGAAFKDAPAYWGANHYRWQVKATRRWRKLTPEREEHRANVTKLLAIAERYEAACAHAKAVSGFPAASERREAAGKALGALVNRIDDEPARTMAGIRIKARAFEAWEHAPRCHRLLNVYGSKWSTNFARAVLAVVEG